jgi:chaperonin GroES
MKKNIKKIAHKVAKNERTKTEAKKESTTSVSAAHITHKNKIQPLGDRVLVLERTGEEKETKTASGIIIPAAGEGGDKGSKKGEVIAVGPGRHEDGKVIPISVKVGDKVMFQWGDKLVLDSAEIVKDEDYYLVRESEILAVIK